MLCLAVFGCCATFTPPWLLARISKKVMSSSAIPTLQHDVRPQDSSFPWEQAFYSAWLTLHIFVSCTSRFLPLLLYIFAFPVLWLSPRLSFTPLITETYHHLLIPFSFYFVRYFVVLLVALTLQISLFNFFPLHNQAILPTASLCHTVTVRSPRRLLVT